MVEITEKEYAGLKDSQRVLDLLVRGGVDEWAYYGDCLKPYFKEKEIESLYNKFIDDLNDVISEADIRNETDAYHPMYSVSFDEDFVITLVKDLHDKISILMNESI